MFRSCLFAPISNPTKDRLAFIEEQVKELDENKKSLASKVELMIRDCPHYPFDADTDANSRADYCLRRLSIQLQKDANYIPSNKDIVIYDQLGKVVVRTDSDFKYINNVDLSNFLELGKIYFDNDSKQKELYHERYQLQTNTSPSCVIC